jgi:ABC-type transport system substrate-binding protein
VTRLPRIVAGLLLAWVAIPGTAWAAPAAQAAAAHVLRYAFPVAETGFDPAQLSDVYSRTVVAGMLEAPYRFDYLARPARMRPLTAEALPEISADTTRLRLRIRPGIYFADDPAFGGRPRELVAADYVYAIKRHYDPRWNSPNLYLLENAGLLGLSELRRQAIERKQPFDYDTEVAGLRAPDRYTLEIRLARPAPRFAQTVLTDHAAFGAVAREVVERYGDQIMSHPVGTGAFRLGEWRRSSRIVLERNPNFRAETWDEQPAPDDAEGQAIAQRLRGRRLPLLDRIEISIIEEEQPRWLAFLQGEADLLERLPNAFVPLAIPANRLAPHLARKGINMHRAPQVDVVMAAIFNMEHPLVGGYTPEKVALRRAIGLAYNAPMEMTQARKGQALPAETAIAPMTFGHDPAVRTDMSLYDPARARALLDLYGYTDRDGDGWRDLPDGQPLVLEYATQADQASRQLAEIWDKSMKAVGLRIRFKVAQWPENLKALRAGRLMLWGVGWSAGTPDGDTFLALGYGPNTGQSNHARFRLPAYDALYERQSRLTDGPERQALMQQAAQLMTVHMPYKFSAHRIVTDLTHPQLIGYRRNPFVREFFRYVDVAR